MNTADNLLAYPDKTVPHTSPQEEYLKYIIKGYPLEYTTIETKLDKEDYITDMQSSKYHHQ